MAHVRTQLRDLAAAALTATGAFAAVRALSAHAAVDVGAGATAAVSTPGEEAARASKGGATRRLARLDVALWCDRGAAADLETALDDLAATAEKAILGVDPARSLVRDVEYLGCQIEITGAGEEIGRAVLRFAADMVTVPNDPETAEA